MLNKKKFILYFLLLLAFYSILCCREISFSNKADIVLMNGKIVTMNENMPQAEALAIKANRILKVCSDREVASLIGEETKVINLERRLVVPGFIDAHVHPFAAGHALTVLDLKGLSKEQILEKVARKAKEVEQGEWIEGTGWDQGFWKEQKFPTKHELDAVTPDNPVVLARIDSHSAWYNSFALRLSNITKNTQDPEGGRIIRDAEGEPTGILIDTAMYLIERGAYEGTLEDKEEYIKLAMEQYKKWGITGIHDAGADRHSIQVYERLIQEDNLSVRVYAMISADSDAFHEYLVKGPQIGLGNNFLTIRSVKILIDGALGSHGAMLFEPYSDSPETTGLQLVEDDRIYSIIKESSTKGFQVCIHAIGDKANSVVLDLYNKALMENPIENHRFRIEHASLIRKEDVLRFKKLNVIAAMQPIFIGEYGRWSEDRLGSERVKGVLIFRQLLDAGVIVAGGTDTPASDSGNPLINFYTAVTRKSPFGLLQEWYSKEKVTREEALKMLTINAAYSAFEEDIKGSIEEGKFADIIVLSKDIMTIKEEDILKTKVLMTILDGEIIYSSY